MFKKAQDCADTACVEVEFNKANECSTGSCVEVAFKKADKCSGGTCVEVDFQKATECTNGSCVEVGATQDQVLVRNSVNPNIVTTFTLEEWKVFVEGVKKGEFDFE